MHRRGFAHAVANWQQNVDGFFNLVGLEIGSRLFVLHEPIDVVTERIVRLSGGTALRR
jgi:hypothetical protein